MQNQNQNSRGPTAPVTTIIPCSKCGEPQTVPLSEGVIERFKATLPRMRPVIQTVFPNLTLDEREMLKTGFCPKCWDKIFDESPRTASEGTPHPDPAKDHTRMDQDDYQSRNPGAPDPLDARRPHHAIPSGHSDGEGYDGGDR